MQSILNLTQNELENWLISIQQQKYRAKQVLTEIYRNGKFDFEEMTSLPKDLREKLKSNFSILSIKSHKNYISEDNSSKILIEFENNTAIECVLIPNLKDNGRTICISTQEGCRLNCKFCATGKLGFKRNLDVAEIISQVLFADYVSKYTISNIVLMGMGDPLDNYENVAKALDIIIHQQKLFGKNRITLSTVGFPENIMLLADSGLNIKLAFSLHSAVQKKREEIIPTAKKWKINQILKALEYYYNATKQPVTFEYIVFDGFNNTDADITALKTITSHFPCKINLIQYHDIEFTGYNSELKSANVADIRAFQQNLSRRGIKAFLRKSAGEDIAAACGQLAYGKKK